MTATAVRPELLLRELSALWTELGRSGAGDAAVLRACAMTLIVCMERSDDPAVRGEGFASLMRAHPSRAILLSLQASDAAQLQARVYAQCWMPFGRRQHICCEQVDIQAGFHHLPGLHALLRPLVVPDLPVVLWVRHAGLFDHPEARQLLPLAGTLVVQGAIELLGELRGSVRRLADLAWTAITPWREAIALTFEDAALRQRLPQVREIRVAYEGAAPPAPARYLAAWLRARLSSARVALAPGAGPYYAGIASVAFDGADVFLGFHETGCAEVRTSRGMSHAVMPVWDDAELLRRELSILAHDPHFEESLSRAQEVG